MTKRKGLCKACESEELKRSYECYRRERAAMDRGQPYECTCPPLPCDIDPNHATNTNIK